jgi:hypothetical protein
MTSWRNERKSMAWQLMAAVNGNIKYGSVKIQLANGLQRIIISVI